jgi:hypothetical protein
MQALPHENTTYILHVIFFLFKFLILNVMVINIHWYLKPFNNKARYWSNTVKLH